MGNLASVVVMLLVLGILAYVFIGEFIVPFWVEKRNDENKGKMKKLCLECKYCKVKKYDPYKYSREYSGRMVHDIPTYCRKIKKELNGKYNCRCIIKDADLVCYEKED